MTDWLLRLHSLGNVPNESCGGGPLGFVLEPGVNWNVPGHFIREENIRDLSSALVGVLLFAGMVTTVSQPAIAQSSDPVRGDINTIHGCRASKF
ncbi:MAG: hypothetical protein CL868_13275 [Cytophagaceae bacterium]|nr:hypothetical protein [Cytophagaceae bacterium]